MSQEEHPTDVRLHMTRAMGKKNKSPENQGFYDGADGSRTRVRKSVPCPSTIIVCYLTFPPAAGSRHLTAFSSFMIRPYVQSLAYVVSRIVDARIRSCGWPRADSSCN